MGVDRPFVGFRNVKGDINGPFDAPAKAGGFC
jgi:hypothetical protein